MTCSTAVEGIIGRRGRFFRRFREHFTPSQLMEALSHKIFY
jgi:hypothetical protein